MPRGPKKQSIALPIAAKEFRKASEAAHEVIYDRINDSLESMDRALEDLALGTYMLVEVDGAERRVYKKEPNLEALKYRMDRVMGRPVARSESGQPGEFQGYESFLKGMIDKRKVIVQTPVVLRAANDTADTELPEIDGPDDGVDRESVVKRLFS